MEIRFHSPYRHWFSGLLAELVVFGGFVGIVIAICLLVSAVS